MQYQLEPTTTQSDPFKGLSPAEVRLIQQLVQALRSRDRQPSNPKTAAAKDESADDRLWQLSFLLQDFQILYDRNDPILRTKLAEWFSKGEFTPIPRGPSEPMGEMFDELNAGIQQDQEERVDRLIEFLRSEQKP
jgi:hypothetical protein